LKIHLHRLNWQSRVPAVENNFAQFTPLNRAFEALSQVLAR